MDLYDASLPLMRYYFPQVGADLRKPTLAELGIHYETTDTGWRIMQYACLLPGCMVPRRGGLPVQKWSPT